MAGMDLSRATWRKSSRSDSSANCVEVTFDTDTVATRDSKNHCGPILLFPATAWSRFLTGVTSA